MIKDSPSGRGQSHVLPKDWEHGAHRGVPRPPPGLKGYGLHRGVPGLTLCRQRPAGCPSPPHNVIPGNPRGRAFRCGCPGSKGGRRRPISVVAALPRRPPRDHADRATLGRRRRTRRPGLREDTIDSLADSFAPKDKQPCHSERASFPQPGAHYQPRCAMESAPIRATWGCSVCYGCAEIRVHPRNPRPKCDGAMSS